MYLIGRITNTHGIRGELKVESLSDFERFKPGKTIYVDDKGNYIPLTIESVRSHQKWLLVKFVGFDNINDVLIYKGLKLYVKDKPENVLEADEYFYDDLIGKKVCTDEGEDVGVITSLIEVPQGHLIDVKKIDGKQVLIPFVSFFIMRIDDEQVIIKPIEGLL